MYDKKFKINVVNFYKSDKKHTYRMTCEVFGITQMTLRDWIKKYDETGDIKHKTRVVHNKKVNPNELKAYVEEHPDAFQYEIAEHFNCSQPYICILLKNLGFTLKKRQNATENKTQRKYLYTMKKSKI